MSEGENQIPGITYVSEAEARKADQIREENAQKLRDLRNARVEVSPPSAGTGPEPSPNRPDRRVELNPPSYGASRTRAGR